MSPNTKAIFLERWTSDEIQKIKTAVNEINNELTNNPMVTNGETAKVVAA
jgi:hypothetical protein